MIDDFPTTNDFLKLFYNAIPYGFLEFRLLQTGKHFPDIHWLELPNQLNQAQLDFLHQRNEQGYNVYFGVTVRNGKQVRGGGKVGDALFTRVLWVDMDSHEQTALDRLHAEKPSLIVDSGGGYHGYWLLNQVLTIGGAQVPASDRGVFASADDELLKRTLKGMAIHLQADVKVAEFARIMRLPSFKNMKPERDGALCHVVDDKLFTYDFDLLANRYAWLVKSETRVERSMPIVASDELPKAVKDYLAMPMGQGGRNDALNKAAYILHCRGMNEGEIYRALEPRASADGLDDHEITTTIRSACNAPVVQMNPRVAARDRGMVSE